MSKLKPQNLPTMDSDSPVHHLNLNHAVLLVETEKRVDRYSASLLVIYRTSTFFMNISDKCIETATYHFTCACSFNLAGMKVNILVS